VAGDIVPGPNQNYFERCSNPKRYAPCEGRSIQRKVLPAMAVRPVTGQGVDLMDIVFVGLTVGFFILSGWLISALSRL
jgi:hypothetical protein